MRRRQNPSIPLPAAFSMLLAATVLASSLQGAELVQGVRSKLSAADLASGEAAVEAYRLAKGIDSEYLNAVGWLARGAEMLGKRDKAAAWVAELRREIPAEAPGTIVPLGAAIEVEGRLDSGQRRTGRRDTFPRGRAGARKGHLPQVENPEEPQHPDPRG